METLIDILQKNLTYLALNSFREYCMKIMHSIREEHDVMEISFDISAITPVPGKQLRVDFEFHYVQEVEGTPTGKVLDFTLNVPSEDGTILHFQEDHIKEIQSKLFNGLTLAFEGEPNFIVLAFSKLIGAYVYLGIANRRFDNGAIYHFAY